MNQLTAKRKYPRFNKDCEIRYKILDMGEMPHDGKAVNVSGGGARFKSGSEIPVEAVLALELTLPNAKAPVMAMGKVVWCKDNGDGTFDNGVEFWWLGYRGESGADSTPPGETRTE